MAQLVSPRSATRVTATKRQVPLPTGGLNARDPLTEMEAGDLLVADNVVIRKDGAHGRPGFYPVASDLAGPVQTLAPYHLTGRTTTVFAATPTKLYRLLSVNGPAIEIGTHTSGWLAHATLSNPGGTFLTLVNGTNAPRLWTGNSLMTPVYEPVWPLGQPVDGWNATRLHQVCVHRTMKFFAELNSLRLWHLDHNAIMGPLHPLDLAPVCRKGGYVVAIASSSGTGGRTTEDKLYAITSAGELVVYGGIDPNNASTWGLVGVYDVGKPVGRRCFTNMGGTLYLATTDGIERVAAITPKAKSEQEYTAVTDKIRDLWYEVSADPSDALAFVDGGNAGFKLVTLPDGRQLVQESQTGAWSMFSGLDAQVFCEADGVLLAGCTGSVIKLASDSDDGAPIQCYVGHAYNEFGTMDRKKFSRCRLKFRRVAPAHPKIGMMLDHEDLPQRFTSRPIQGAYWRWAEMSWPKTPAAWTREAVTANENLWRGLTGRGHAGAFLVSWQGVSPLVYAGADVLFEAGGTL